MRQPAIASATLSDRHRALRRLLALAALVACWGAASGCVVVQPWQRGRLAKQHMQIPPAEGETHLDQHIATSKEAAAGGATLQGGGCGCN